MRPFLSVPPGTFGGRGRRVLLAATLLLCGAGSAAAQSMTYTTDADFDLGDLFNVNHDFPNNDQLQLDVFQVQFPFLVVPASGRGTIVRIDAETGAILGEYRTAPQGLATDPSRTTVDSRGNAWAGNRARDTTGLAGSLAQVGLIIGGTRVDQNGVPDPNGGYLAPPFDYSTCVDRDGDGLIRTSMGLGDVLAWPDITDGMGGMGGPALVQDAFDECILIYQRIDCPNVRHISPDANDDVWVGGYPFIPTCFQRLSGVDGSVLQTVPTAGLCGGFGGIVDGLGVLWSASISQNQLMRFDPGIGGSPACIGTGTAPAGVVEDPSGFIWVSGGNQLRRFSSQGTQLNVITVPGASGLLGLASTPVDGHLWVASFDTDQVFRVDPSGPSIVPISTGRAPNGVSVDANGRVWVLNLDDDNAQRINPQTNSVDLTVPLGVGALPFSPSDMTAAVGFPATVPFGDWTVIFDGGALDLQWGTVSWNGDEPNGAKLETFVRSANAVGQLPALPFMQVQNGVQFSSSGRFIEIQVQFTKAPIGNDSPILFDLTVMGSGDPPGPEDCIKYNNRHPGSLLLYPEFDNRAGVVSVLTVTNVDCEGDDVWVEFVYLREDDCHEFNRTRRLTPCDTITLLTNFDNPNHQRGYVYAFAKNGQNGEAIVHNALIGNLLVVDGIYAFDYSVNPLVLRGIGDGVITDLDGDGVRDLDGLEYDMIADQILIPRFLGQGIGQPPGTIAGSQLILIGLTGGQEFTTRVDFLIYNDNEEVFSAEHEFRCWAKPYLLDISGIFANSFLKDWTNHAPNEIIGAPTIESGWFRVDGAVASSVAVSFVDPAIYAVLVERIGSYGAADLPFEFCSQPNGALLQRGIFGE